MPDSIKSMIAGACLAAVVLSAAACSPRRIPPLSVSDLMEDRVMLDGVLMKCNENPAKARNNMDCLNARIAIDRLASQREPEEAARRAAEFEKNREQLRLAQEKQRQEEEAKVKKVDAYHLPVIPVDPPPLPPPPPAQNPPPPIMGKTNP